MPGVIPWGAMFPTLVTTDDVAAHLNEPAWALIDCRFDLTDTSRGEQAYRSAHLPGASYAHLDRDLSAATTGTNGRHPLPGLEALGATLGRLGIEPGVQVVAYDQDNGMYASRLWWMLRYLSHDAVAVLDGGFAKWAREGRPTAAGDMAPQARHFTGTPRPGMLARVDEVQASLGDSAHLLLDARAPERYAGAVEPLDPVAGHIPGAVNHPFTRNVASDGSFLTTDGQREIWRAVLGATPPSQVVCYCGSGVTACHNLLAMAHVGLEGVRLYAGSWSEWCSDPSRPVER